MKKLKISSIFIVLILFVFLFPSNLVFAGTATGKDGVEYTYSDTDDGTDGPNVEDLRFQITYYGAGGEGTLSGTGPDQFRHLNEKHKWNEIEIDGEYYAVIAAATHWMIKNGGDPWYWTKKFDHIHYFKTHDNMSPKECEKIKFKFEDQNFDSEVYNGVILDTGGPQMFPQNYSGFESKVNILDFYYDNADDGAQPPEADEVNGKIILVSMNGSFKGTTEKEEGDEELTFGEKILNLITKFLIWIGDFIQKLLDKTGTELSDKEAKRILYTKGSLKSTKNKFCNEIQVGEPGETIDKLETKAIKDASVSNTIENKNGNKEEVFTKEKALIPVIPVDAYTIVGADIELFDIDFLGNDNQNENGLWKLFRGLVSAISHVILYVSVAAIIGILIWRGILVVVSSYTENPQVKEKSKNIINNLAKAVIYIVGIYVIIAILINLYKLAILSVTGGENSKYLIRLSVENLYSFNTNIVGWARFMTQSTNIGMSFKWSLAYLGMAVINAICFLAMFVRTIFLGLLIMIAPIISINKINETDTQRRGGLFHFSGWIRAFLIVLWIPFPTVALISLFLHI